MKKTQISYLGRGKPAPKTTEDNELLIAFVGAGGAFTKANGKGETNLVLVHQDYRAAIDCGRTWPENLPTWTGFTLAEIDAFFVSHAHADHANGLATSAQECRWIQKRKPTLALPEALEPFLWGQTLAGGLAHDTSPTSTVHDYFDVVRPEPIDERAARFTLGGLEIEIFRTCHAPSAAKDWRDAMVSYGLYLPKFRVFVSMDTRFDPELLDSYAARGAEWFFHDATRAGNVHAAVPELLTLPEEVRGSMVLIHTPDDFAQMEARAFAADLPVPSVANRGDAFRFTV